MSADLPLTMTVLDDPNPLPPADVRLREAIKARGRQRRRLRVVAFVAPLTAVAAGLVVLAVLQGLPSPSTNPAVPTPTLSHTPAPSPSTHAPTYLPHGQVGPRSAVPWSEVGPGWFLHLSPVPFGAAPRILSLVDPVGGRYELTTWSAAELPTGQVLDWSPDGRRALIAGSDLRFGFASSQPTRVYVVDLRTGAKHPLTFAAGFATAAFSRPTGARLVAVVAAPGGYRLAHVSLDSGAVVAFGATYPDANVRAMYSPDGTTLVVSALGRLTLVGNDGKVRRTLPLNWYCQPTRWWDSDSVLVQCSDAFTPPRLWRVPVDGSAPVAMTALLDGKGQDLGDTDAWRLPSGTYVQAEQSCGAPLLMREAADQTLTPVSGSLGSRLRVVASVADRLAVVAADAPGCTESGGLLWFDPSTGRSEAVLPGTTAASLLAYPDELPQPLPRP